MNYPTYPNYAVPRYGAGGGDQRNYAPPAPNNPYYYGAPVAQPTSYLSNFQNYDPVALQMRIVKARQVNLMCKQNLVRNMLLSRSSSAQDQQRNSPLSTQQQRDPPQQYHPSMYQTSQMSQNQQQYQPAYPPQSQYPYQAPIQPQYQMPQQVQPAPSTQPQSNQYQPNSSENNRAQAAPPPISTSKPTMMDILDRQLADLPLSRENSAAVNSPPYERVNQPSVASANNDQQTHTYDSDDDAVPLTSRPVINKQAPREDAKILNTLAESMTQAVTESADTLKKLTAARKKQLPAAEKAKRRVEHLIKVNANAPVVMPLWRHKLNGRMDPPKEAILKGVRLFRLIVRSLIMLFIRPIVTSLKHKLALRERQRKEFQKSLRIVSGSLDDWLGKLVALPVTSVTQDANLNFEPVESFGTGQPLRQRLLQLKVRLKGVVMGVVKAGMPSELITDFLVALVEDNNYFTTGVLWDCEVAQLDFSSLGATRDLVPLAVADTPEKDIEIIPGEDGSGDLKINVARVRLILQNFLFVRALASHLLLSPWCYNLCGQPSSRALKRCVYNHRVLATAMYELMRSTDPTLPAIDATPFTGAAPVADSAQDGEDGARFVHTAKKRSTQYQYIIGDSLIGGPSSLPTPVQVPVNLALPGGASTRSGVESVRNGAAAGSVGMSVMSGYRAGTATGASAAVSGIPTSAQSARRMSERPPTTGSAPTPTIASPSAESAIPSAATTAGPAENTTGAGTEVAPSKATPLTSMFGKFAKLVGITDVVVFDPSSGSIETHLLELRGEFTSLSALHSLLIPPAQQSVLRTHFDEWFPELKAPLREWMRQLVVHVLKRRQLLNKLARDKKEAVV